ncbi:MAG: hypothetical protein AB9903_21725 [Vulcanimicrobiota bacterium]
MGKLGKNSGFVSIEKKKPSHCLVKEKKRLVAKEFFTASFLTVTALWLKSGFVNSFELPGHYFCRGKNPEEIPCSLMLLITFGGETV